MGLFSFAPDITDLFHGGGHGGGGPGLTSQINTGFDKAFDYVNQGTTTAADYLRSGYENLFNQREQGLIGGFGESSSRMGAQAASQGLSPDVVQRMLFAPGQELQGQLGSESAAAKSGLNFDLAQLFKGTGSELAGLTRDQLAILANWNAAKKGAKAQETAGMYQGIGSFLGSLAGVGLGGA